MSSIEGIPSYVLQNMASVQENIRSIIADTMKNGGAKVEFDNFLSSAFSDIASTFNDEGFADGLSFRNSAYQNAGAPGIASNMGSTTNMAQLMNQKIGSSQNISNAESTAVVKKAYDSLLNGDMANQLSPALASLDKNSLTEKLKKLNSAGGVLDKNTSLITDEEFYDAETLTPNQITDILKQKGSPYAYQTFEGGKSIGQLIYDGCHGAGTVAQGSHTLNPALIIAIMGAESGFGTDSKAVKNNPFNIRLNGGFNNVPNLETSLNMAVNTMYNWAKSRPENSKVSLLDYAGDKYCENYTEKWKPNVEKYFLEFSLHNSNPVIDTKKTVANTEQDQKQKIMSQVLSSMGTDSMGNGMNIENLLKMAVNKNGSDNAMENVNMLSSLNSASMFDNKDE